ncbi:hypothetical protein VNO77_34685 [Canavalia gladiata]|uniref:Uncharacterized protein n=1 Tax=Canavalia gladiata TaxID=3824 RepID=A0AAN9KH27_CANGL
MSIRLPRMTKAKHDIRPCIGDNEVDEQRCFCMGAFCICTFSLSEYELSMCTPQYQKPLQHAHMIRCRATKILLSHRIHLSRCYYHSLSSSMSRLGPFRTLHRLQEHMYWAISEPYREPDILEAPKRLSSSVFVS